MKQRITEQAERFLSTMHSELKPHEKLQLVLDTRQLCDNQLASQVYSKVKEHIGGDTSTRLCSSILIRIPLAPNVVKNKVRLFRQQLFHRHQAIPHLYGLFLSSTGRGVR